VQRYVLEYFFTIIQAVSLLTCGVLQNFEVQLGPFVTEAEKRGTAQFKWTQGAYNATPPPGFEDYFGAGPLYRFFDYDGINAFDMLEKIRSFPEGTSAEDTMRQLMGEDAGHTIDSVRKTLQELLDIIDADPEIEVSQRLFAGVLNLLLISLRVYWDTPREVPLLRV
jgi:hypothetical protein